MQWSTCIAQYSIVKYSTCITQWSTCTCIVEYSTVHWVHYYTCTIEMTNSTSECWVVFSNRVISVNPASFAIWILLPILALPYDRFLRAPRTGTWTRISSWVLSWLINAGMPPNCLWGTCRQVHIHVHVQYLTLLSLHSIMGATF